MAPAVAADLPVKAVPVAIAQVSWSGFYVGGNAGAAWFSDSAVLSLPPGPPQAFAPFLAIGSIPPTGYGTNGSGFIGGLQIGYNWQIQNWVLGIEADYAWTSANNTQT